MFVLYFQLALFGFAYRARAGADTRFRWMVWDSDTAMRYYLQDVTLSDYANSPAQIFHKLMTNSEFRQLLTDRLYKFVINSAGPLTPNRCGDRYTALATTVDQAVIAESARWGDYMRDVYPLQSIESSIFANAMTAYLYSRDLPANVTDPANAVLDTDQKTWVDVRDSKLTLWCPQRSTILINQYKANGWYNDTLKAPNFAQEGGAVAANFALAITNPNSGGAGDIYYTSDGSDPRLAGGAIAATATNGGDAANVAINQVLTIKARVLSGGQWSALHEAIFYPPQPFENLVINEINYHPAVPATVDSDLFQFIELHNKGTTPLRLDNVYFSRGLFYRFPLGATLPAGAFVVLSADLTQFKARHKFDAFGQFRGDLSNKGETIELLDAVGNLIDTVAYADVAPWPTTPDGTGPSLSLVAPTSDNAVPQSWAASTAVNGTPGQPNDGTVVNQPPIVSISSPASGISVTVATPVTINASASDLDGTVAQVAFFANSSAIANCVDSSAPFECSWTPAQTGSYSLTAQASDNVAAQGVSTAVTVNVVAAPPPNQAPTVAIVAPINGLSVAVGATLVIQATAADADGTVAQVSFLANDDAIPGCVDSAAPFECSWTPTLAGDVTLTAVASDQLGSSTVSTEVIVKVTPGSVNQLPTATIDEPINDATFTAGAPLTITASASDPGGTVARVTFLANGAPIAGCERTAAPFVCVWTPENQAYTLTVQVTDSNAAVVTSLPVAIKPNVVLPPTTGNRRIFLPTVYR